MIPWKYIMLHHSASPDRVASDWEGIRRYHMSWKYQGDIISAEEAGRLQAKGQVGVEPPWSDIGYHFGVELVDSQYRICQGRSLDQFGAHCFQAGMNRLSIGLCFLGNFDAAPPPEAQLAVGRALVERLISQVPSLQKPSCLVLHRTFATYKTCPGKAFPVEKFCESLSLPM